MISKHSLALAFLFLVALEKCAGAPSKERGAARPLALFQGPQIYLSVSAEAGYRFVAVTNHTTSMVDLLDRMLELHWLNFDNQPGDVIGLYSENPAGLNESAAEQYLLEQHPVLSSSGKVKTSVRYERRPLDSDMNRCLGFWIAYFQTNGNGNGTTVVQSNCLMIHPTWMNDIKSEIQYVPLSSLMIPGTHNAGSWYYYAGMESENPYTHYTYCQEDTIYDQLINGIRSLDVRVGHYPSTAEKFYINHDIARLRPLKTLLEDVWKFVHETNEIVFLDFHRFPVGFNDQEAHDELVKFIEDHFEFMLAPRSLTLSTTPGRLWQIGRNIIIFYSDSATVARHDILWPGVDQAWADTNKLNELEAFLESSLTNDGCRGSPWSAMAQLTSTVMDAIVRPYFGVRGYANITNDEVSKWYQRESWYSKSMIIALDFYRSTNIIETAIEVNKNHGNVCL